MPTNLQKPCDAREIENLWIPLSDGCRLSARVWLPLAVPFDAPAAGVPAILEYLPYRKNDATANQDSARHPYFAGHGFASVRVDMRGAGDSDGVLLGEYLAQEQDDAVEVIAWIAEQPWCSGSVGMIGYSWGGFNGLQVAARRPPQLKAVVSVYSTDDRYADDCHYMGGCLLASDMLKWATTMRAYNALPPDPRTRSDWREVWLWRLAQTPAFIGDWLSHQTRDEFWASGSVAEDYSAIEAATLVVGGWADAYTNAVPRLLEHLTCERKGIIGPWAHVMPYIPSTPGPQVGFLQECVRWFRRWLADEPTGVEDDPLLRVWIEGAAEASNASGGWFAEDAWPPPGVKPWALAPEPGGALTSAERRSGGSETVTITSPQHLGRTAGVWCPGGSAEDLPGDQRADDELSVVFDTGPLDGPLVLLGQPTLRLAVASDRPTALVAARLCEVSPDGASTLVSWGLLNLTHRQGDDAPRPLEPGREYEALLRLNAVGHRFSAGSRIRLALSSAYWPHAWPAPVPATLRVGLSGSVLELPAFTASGAPYEPFGPAEDCPRIDPDSARGRVRCLSFDVETGVHRISDHEEGRTFLASTETTFTKASDDEYTIAEDDPLTARTRAARRWSLEREGWHARVVAEASVSCEADVFVVDDTLQVWEGDRLVHDSTQRFRIARRGV